METTSNIDMPVNVTAGRVAAAGTSTGEGPGAAYVSTQFRTTEMISSTIEPNTGKPSPGRQNAIDPAKRYAINEYLSEATRIAEQMEEASSGGEILNLVSFGMAITERLRSLWRLREYRTDDWATIVNFLQGILAGAEFEDFTQDQCTALRLVFQQNLHPDADENDVASSIVVLERAGFNPWRGIAQK